MKNTGILFIGVAILTILLHSVIPHHHHSDSIFSHFDKNCTSANHYPGDEDNSTHCHAFNELAVDKINNSANFKIDISALKNSLAEIPVPVSVIKKTAYFNEKRITLYSFLFKLLRGPPVNMPAI